MTDLISTTNALALPQQGTPVHCGVLFPTAWIAPHNMTFGDWELQGQVFLDLWKSLQFAIGDWLNTGERRYGETYTQAIEVTDRSQQTLEQYKWVTGAIEPARRYPTLSYTHHRYVARLPPDEQNYWLREAHELGWSSAELKQKLVENYAKQTIIPKRLGAEATPTEAATFIKFYYDDAWTQELVERLQG